MKTQNMKYSRLKIALMIVVCSAAPSLAGELGNINTRNCTWCHGPSAQGYAPAPRLAGQRLLYLENQLRGYIEHKRNNPFSELYMWHAAANIGPQEMRYLANYFAGLRSRAANDGNRALVTAGRAIYEEGLPGSNIVACIACHGPQAQGVREIPRLGGLAYDYLKRRLEQWHEGYDKSARHPMPHVASRLLPNQIAALASYLSFIK